MNESKPYISFIVVEYHSIEEIERCTAAIAAHMDCPFEVIVSSNSCYTDAERQALPANDHTKWIFNPKNGGFAYAMNRGFANASGKYLVAMNSDCTIQEGLMDMMQFMEQHPGVGAIAPRLEDQDGNVQDSARPYVTLPRYIARQLKRIARRQTSILDSKTDYSKVQTVDWVIGAFIMVSRQAYEQTGGFDETFFMYAEDLDWCTRIRAKGLEVVYFPRSTVVYKGTRRARSNKKYASIFIKSHIAYWRKFGFFYGHPKRKDIKAL